MIDVPASATRDPRDAKIERSASCDDATVMRLWRECGLPEYFLGNGGTNHKLVAFMDRIRNEGEIKRGATEMSLSDVYNLDDVIVALGIEDSDITPAEAVAKLHAEIEQLREDAAEVTAIKCALGIEDDNGSPVSDVKILLAQNERLRALVRTMGWQPIEWNGTRS